jgi:hypothetical protein
LPGVSGDVSPFTNLRAKDDVLVNLELAYETGNSTEYSRLLDVAFSFYFSEEDVELGDVLTGTWDRSVDRIAFSYMFEEPVPTGIALSSQFEDHLLNPESSEEPTWGYVKNYFFVSPWDSVETLNLDLQYVEGEEQWVPFVDQGSGETWYRKEVQYSLSVESGRGMQFECTNGVASFVVRGQTGSQTWQLVEWYDIKPWYEDLQDKDDILLYLESAYNSRSLLKISRLLDENFVFFFSESDFVQGLTPEQWDRASEINATSNMFSGHAPPGGYPINAINVNLTYPPDVWTAFNPPEAPTETWYQKTVSYDIVVNADPFTFIGTDITMIVQIRYADVGEESFWRLVRWRDDYGLFAQSWRSSPSPVVEEVTWGAIKALYSG